MNGIEKTIDGSGRVVLPKKYLDSMKLKPGDDVVLSFDDSVISIKKKGCGCIFCGSEFETVSFKGQCVCADCVYLISKTKQSRYGE